MESRDAHSDQRPLDDRLDGTVPDGLDEVMAGGSREPNA
jgi:hypothetical protein